MLGSLHPRHQQDASETSTKEICDPDKLSIYDLLTGSPLSWMHPGPYRADAWFIAATASAGR
jgi:hypothetical protein